MHSETSFIQDVEVPPHLFQTSGNAESMRDKKNSISWEPKQSLPILPQNSVETKARRRTQDSNSSDESSILYDQPSTSHLHRVESLSPSALPGDHDRPWPYQIESHGSRSPASLTRIPESAYQAKEHKLSSNVRAPISWSVRDPFSAQRKSSGASAFGPTLHSQVPVIQSLGKQRMRSGTEISVLKPSAPDKGLRRWTITSDYRRNSLWQTYEKAKTREVELQRKKYVQIAFEYTIYAILLLFIYLVLIGVPLWRGAVYWLWWVVDNKFVITGGFGITLGVALFYAFAPLLMLFERDPPLADDANELKRSRNVEDTALLIPCYKSASLIAATLEAALKIFPRTHIFVIANGNSPMPLDETEEVCRPYGVNHVWSPIGSKIIAQFVGCYAAKAFKNVLLIDDDCALPENFPIVTERLVGRVQCVGYTIKSVGPNSSKGNLCQQAQDLEYKLSGIQRMFAGCIGSATFPHGAISLWNREMLVRTFYEHPGFSVSEDWFFGHVARQLGCRITMCTCVFVETETPRAVFFSTGGARGGFGEMTIFQQRFKRWNFFFVNGLWYNLAYIGGSWKLGWCELGAKIFVFQEVYETLLYLFTPFILPISLYVRPGFCGILLASTIVMYLINVIVFNEIHLRRKNERLGWTLIYIYYLPYKIALTGINVASCYWSLWKYARYFARRHPKVVEDEKALAIVMRLEERLYDGGRRMTVGTITRRSMTTSENHTSIVHKSDLSDYPFVAQPSPVHVKSYVPSIRKEGIAAPIQFSDKRAVHFSRQRAIEYVRSIAGGKKSSSATEKKKRVVIIIDDSSDEEPSHASDLPLSPMQAALLAHNSMPSPRSLSQKHLTGLWLSRICRTAAHELGHCFGIDHCVYYACSMQGSASIVEDARQPPYLCLVDLAKVLKATGADEKERYEMIQKWCESERRQELGFFGGYGSWIGRRVEEMR